MICPDPACSVERDARTLESMRTRPFSAQTETSEHCKLCRKLVCWERIVREAKDGTVTVELRLKRKTERDAA